MKSIRGMRLFTVGALLAAYGASAAAQAVDETEKIDPTKPNYPVALAQPLAFDNTGTAMVNAFLGSGDADLFSFSANAGDVITVDIDGGVKPGAGSVDTIVAVHHPAALNYAILRQVDDAPVDPGSLGTEDSYIQNLVIQESGVHIVSVAGFPNQVGNGAVLLGGPGNATGTYTLIVTFVSRAPVAEAPAPEPEPVVPAPDPVVVAPDPVVPDPVVPDADVPAPEVPVADVQVMQVSIDIKPGQRGVARIYPKSRHEIPVALLSSRDFDALKVDVSSLTFGRTGDEKSLDKCYRHGVHVNRDRRRDLVCQFENHLAAFETSDEEAILRGKTLDGTPFEARGMLKVMPEKRHTRFSGKRHDDDDDDHGRHRNRRHR